MVEVEVTDEVEMVGVELAGTGFREAEGGLKDGDVARVDPGGG